MIKKIELRIASNTQVVAPVELFAPCNSFVDVFDIEMQALPNHPVLPLLSWEAQSINPPNTTGTVHYTKSGALQNMSTNGGNSYAIRGKLVSYFTLQNWLKTNSFVIKKMLVKFGNPLQLEQPWKLIKTDAFGMKSTGALLTPIESFSPENIQQNAVEIVKDIHIDGFTGIRFEILAGATFIDFSIDAEIK